MPNLRYEFAKLGADYYLSGVSLRYKKKKPVPPPRYVIWDCTRRCNLRCAHCGASKEQYSQELTTGQIKRIVDQLAEAKVEMFAVTGGEPLLRRDLWEVLAFARQKGLKTGFATNGFMIDDSVAGQIRACSVYSVQVSLDGLEQTHNDIRGNGDSFARAVKAIERLAQIPVVSVATTVMPRNLAELDGLRALLAGLGVRLWRLVVVMPIGRAEAADLLLSGDQLAELFNFVRRNKNGKPRIYIGETLPFLAEWEKAIRDAPLVCPIGFMACCIGVDGNVRGCPEQPDTAENREGSLLDTPFSEIWQNGFGRYRSRAILETDSRCSACKARQSCYGGCWVMREGDHHCVYSLLAGQTHGLEEQQA